MSDMLKDEAGQTEAPPARIAGLVAFNTQRKQNSRENLLIAATTLFCRDGYSAVAVEDITNAAGVSRVTFYRHFSTKSAVALDLFERAATQGAPHVLAIGERDWHDRETVISWLTDHFAKDRQMQGILRVLSQASVAEADFTKAAQPFIFDMVAGLGKRIPAFDVQDDPHRRTRAWLLIYTILDQSNRAATTTNHTDDQILIEVLAEHFLAFVRTDAPAPPG